MGHRDCTRLIKQPSPEDPGFCLMYRGDINDCPPKCPWFIECKPAEAKEVQKSGIDPRCLNLDRNNLGKFICNSTAVGKEPVILRDKFLCQDCLLVTYRIEDEPIEIT